MANNRVVLLTGATGFVGSRIARALIAQRCDVIALVRPTSDRYRIVELQDGIQCMDADLDEFDQVERAIRTANPQVLIHAAWHATTGSYLSDTGNIGDLRASLDLFETARLAGCLRIVGIGTCLEYDTRCGWLDEEVSLRPQSLYASAKAALYLAARAWARESDVSFAWTRLFHQYGPGEDRHRLIPSVTTSLLAGLPVQVTRGDLIRDYLFVDDVADAIVTIALSELEDAVNIGSGLPIRIRDVVAGIERHLRLPGLVQFRGLAEDPFEPPFICSNTGRLQRELGWRPETALEAGIATCVDWWANQMDNKLVSRPGSLC